MELNVFYINIKLNSFLHCTLIPTEHLKSLTSCIWMFYASKVFRGSCHLISTHILATCTHMHIHSLGHCWFCSIPHLPYLLVERHFHWRKNCRPWICTYGQDASASVCGICSRLISLCPTTCCMRCSSDISSFLFTSILTLPKELYQMKHMEKII